ncbi:hypothetical protein GCM10007415_13790 [Parapedobacter pyrenivorans]|uniref:Lipocalin-like domain-containing protein n=1 Tax=Parapedobacter pyrenivorans TaxID=1305674 RepID=A0A917HLJ3_9SPHI|nr:hypothetical protein [Parapedobacter pyrenivorans]GGG82214.1 hypothetical protein GCM10007415_13790 [Parapedobacter pyrenivorans]
MRTQLILRNNLFALMAVCCLLLGGCEKDFVRDHGLDADQLVAGRLDGTWGDPTSIVTPDDIPNEIFGGMRLVFTTDADGYPAQFSAKDCPIVFGSEAGTWSVSGTPDSAKVVLSGVAPVDEFDIQVSSTSLTLSFYMGWENTETGEQGEGEFSATLTRK